MNSRKIALSRKKFQVFLLLSFSIQFSCLRHPCTSNTALPNVIHAIFCVFHALRMCIKFSFSFFFAFFTFYEIFYFQFYFSFEFKILLNSRHSLEALIVQFWKIIFNWQRYTKRKKMPALSDAGATSRWLCALWSQNLSKLVRVKVKNHTSVRSSMVKSQYICATQTRNTAGMEKQKKRRIKFLLFFVKHLSEQF